MRFINTPASLRQTVHGVTLIEMMISISIAAILATAAMPAFNEYITNSRLRESGNVLYVQTLLAQSEAIKRNTVMRLTATGNSVTVTDTATNNTVSQRTLSNDVTLDSTDAINIDFSGEGRPVGFAATAIDLTSVSSNITCSSEIRCPGLRVDGGGDVRLCNDKTNCN